MYVKVNMFFQIWGNEQLPDFIIKLIVPHRHVQKIVVGIVFDTKFSGKLPNVRKVRKGK